MRLLKLAFEHLDLFESERLSLDFFASDRVAADRGITPLDAPIYSQNLLAFAGINATGKTTALRLVHGALGILMGKAISADLSNLLFDLSADLVIMHSIFFHEGSFYQLQTTFEIESTPDGTFNLDEWVIAEEELWQSARPLTKKTLSSFDLFSQHAKKERVRSELSKELLDYLPDNVSMVTTLTKDSRQYLSPSLFTDNMWLDLSEAAIDNTVLQVFDDSIESCEHNPKFDWYELSFKSGATSFYYRQSEDLGLVLSDGTVKGANLVHQATLALQTGGYLLVDEIENHLNKQLVGVILDLFESNETNPHGAVLVFSTHYPELLDFIKRKDDVYFFSRSRDHRINAALYSSIVKRIENKKSEVFLSNYVKGTAPRYTAIAALRKYVAKLVDEDD